MPADMRSIVYLGPERIELRRVPIPHPKAGELLVKVRAATTCGTDVKTYLRGHPKFPAPFAFGHEFGGDIIEVGQGVSGFQPGMRVTANVFAECGECFYCRLGQGNLCENLVYNFGAFSEYMIISKSIVRLNTFEIPAQITYSQAAIVEPLVTVVHGQHLVKIQPGEHVAIIGGGGPIGLLHLQLARRAGAAQTIVVEHSPVRLEAARRLGATECINPPQGELVGALRELTAGFGPDVVIECAGTQVTWEASVEAVRRGGRVLWFGGLPGGTMVEVDAGRVHYGELALLGIHGGTARDAREAFALITSRTVDVQALLSGELPLEQVEMGLKKMMAGEVIKMSINPDL